MSPAALAPEAPARVHHLPAAALVALAVTSLVLVPELLGDRGRLGVVLVLQLGLVVAWVLTTGIQGFTGSLAVGAAGAVAADLTVMLPARAALGGLLAVLGVGFLAMVLQQMLRRPRPDLVGSLSGGVLLLCAVCALAVLLLVGRSAAGPRVTSAALVTVGVALVVGHLGDLVLPRPAVAPDVPRGLVGLLLTVLAGAAAGYLTRAGDGLPDDLGAVPAGAILGLVAGLVALAASYVVVEAAGEESPPGVQPAELRWRSWALPVVQAILPIAACVPVALALQTML